MSRPIKVLFASHSGALAGGAERSLLELVCALAGTDQAQPIVSVPHEGDLAAALRAIGVRVVVIPTPFWAPYGSGAFADPTGFGRLSKRARVVARSMRYSGGWLRLLRAERPDVVVTNTVTTAVAALAAKVHGIPHIWMVHEFLTLDHGLEYALGERLSQRLVGSLSELVIVNSEAVGRHFSPRVPERKILVSHPPVVLRPVGPNDVASEPLRLLLLGRQTRSKGSALAVEALSLMRGSAAPPILRLVGWISDDFRAELHALARERGVADRIQISGSTDEPSTALQWANVLLMCSDHEAFGRVTAEALRCGRPVVGSRSGGTPEIVTEGEDGLLFEPGNAADLASALDRLAGDRTLLRRLGDRAVELNSNRFILEDHVRTVVEALNSVTDVRARS